LYHPKDNIVRAEPKDFIFTPEHKLNRGHFAIDKCKHNKNYCKCIIKTYNPVDPNSRWEHKALYDSLHLGPTHHFVENRVFSNNKKDLYLNDDQFQNLRPEARLIEIYPNDCNPVEPNKSRVTGFIDMTRKMGHGLVEEPTH